VLTAWYGRTISLHIKENISFQFHEFIRELHLFGSRSIEWNRKLSEYEALAEHNYSVRQKDGFLNVVRHKENRL
jgi:hypothetical protein